MQSGFTHVLHSIVITAVLYLFMRHVLKQSVDMSTNRSILLGTVVLIYMILFGHNFPPKKLNLI
jgi:putative effector of murein hydrolase